MTQEELSGMVGYMGHQPELTSADIEENILLGDEGNALKISACGPHGRRNCQNAGWNTYACGKRRCAPVGRTAGENRTGKDALPQKACNDIWMILFPQDTETEKKLVKNLRELARDSVVLLLTHRLALFPRAESGALDVRWQGYRILP